MLNLKKIIGTGVAVAATFTAVSLYSSHPARSSDHQDSPTVLARPGADITDVYMFPSPANSSNVVLAMDTHPLIPAGMAASVFFDPAVMYQFKIVHTATAYVPGQPNNTPEDTVIQFSVNGSGTGQTLTMYGPTVPAETGTNSTFVTSAASSTTIPVATVGGTQSATFNVVGSDKNTYPIHVFAGPRADPFFFDLSTFFKIVPDRFYGNHVNGATPPPATASSFRGFTAAYNTANGTSCDTTPAQDIISSGGGTGTGFDVMSIVVEMPKALLELVPGTAGTSQPIIHLWASTSTTSGS